MLELSICAFQPTNPQTMQKRTQPVSFSLSLSLCLSLSRSLWYSVPISPSLYLFPPPSLSHLAEGAEDLLVRTAVDANPLLDEGHRQAGVHHKAHTVDHQPRISDYWCT